MKGFPQEDSPDAGVNPTFPIHYQPLLSVAAALVIGIVADRLTGLDGGVWLLLIGLALAGWGVAYRCHRLRSASVAVWLAVALLGAAWHHSRWSQFAADDIGNWAEASSQPACVEATLLESARRYPAQPYDPFRPIPQFDRTVAVVRADRLWSGRHWRAVEGRALLVIGGWRPGLYGGDRVRIYGELMRPSERQNPEDFDQAAWLRRDRIRAILKSDYPQCVVKMERSCSAGSGSPVNWISPLRRRADQTLWQHLGPRNAALASALLLGARQYLESLHGGGESPGPSVRETFVRTGTVHVLSISGLHVGLLAGLVWGLMRLLAVGPRTTALVVISTAVAYALLAEARAPVVRAAILVCAVFAAQLIGRRGRMTNSLAGALVIVLALNPAELFDTGLQLSFLTAGAFMEVGSSVFRWRASSIADWERLAYSQDSWPRRVIMGVGRSLLWSALVTAVVWLMISPILAARFHILSPVAILLNLIVIPLLGAVLLWGFALLSVHAVLPWLCPALAWLCGRSLDLMQMVVSGAAQLPGGYFYLPGPPEWWVVGFYSLLGLWWVVPGLRQRRWWCRAGVVLAGWCALGLAVPLLQTPPRRLQCTFLSMGHGLAAVLHLPDGRTLLYDAGHMGSPDTAGQSVSHYLWSRGIGYLDAVVISHADADHFNALPTLLERFRIGQVFVSEASVDKPGQGVMAVESAVGPRGPSSPKVPEKAFGRMQELLHHRGVPVVGCGEGDELLWGPGVRMKVLSPPVSGIDDTDNANSLVLLVEHAGKRLLLTGDLEGRGLARLLGQPPVAVDVLLAPHHGSVRSHPPGLLDWSRPRLVVISQGRSAAGPAVEAYRRAGVPVLTTAHSGAIEIELGRDVLRWNGYVNDKERSNSEVQPPPNADHDGRSTSEDGHNRLAGVESFWITKRQ